MIELAALAQEGLIREFSSNPPGPFRPQDDVRGVGLGYSEAFIAIVDRHLGPFVNFPRGTVDHSALMAAALERVAASDSAFGVPSTGSRPNDAPRRVERAAEDWRAVSVRRFGRVMSPIEIEVTVGTRFPREQVTVPAESMRSLGPYPIVYRPSRGSRLHAAQSGGRCQLDSWSDSTQPPWGTLGGFLLSSTSGRMWAVTAEHVVPSRSGEGEVIGTAAYAGVAALGVNRLLQQISVAGLAWPGRTSETGQLRYTIPADVVAKEACSLDRSPSTSGLDVALAEWPRVTPVLRATTPRVPLGDVSQVLAGRFVGAYSGKVAVRVTRYTIWHSYDLNEDGTESACISNCVEIALSRRPYVWTDVSHQGDSGAWILCSGTQGEYWLGMLVGGDGERTGVVPAHRIIDRLEPMFGHLLPLI